MNPSSTPLRYWAFDGDQLEQQQEGRVIVGVAYHAETRQRVTSVQIYSLTPRVLVGELWLTEQETYELAKRLLETSQLFCSGAAKQCCDAGVEAE